MSGSCTMFPDGIPLLGISWGDCCAKHDDAYDSGTTTFEESNDLLYFCIRNRGQIYVDKYSGRFKSLYTWAVRGFFKYLAVTMWYGVGKFGRYFWDKSQNYKEQ